MPVAVRRAEPADLPVLPEIEGAADLLFARLGIVFPPGPTVIEEAIRDGERIYVAGDPPVGFAAVRERDGGTHLEQIAVHPHHYRRGIGTSLMDQVIAHAAEAGSPRITLITFRDVPWNAPWYARFGFTEIPEVAHGPEIRSLWQAEIAAGLHELGPRVVMSARPTPGSPLPS
ncbi:GNAT family N-acetyltransferase [Actinomadura alba]|uniref:GNAT family N-acetyltransferase n=1 Tax=Actinomadura alba TaxID=406431 RepID=A0ABR7LWC9_9ACTN|nr:GNAT family N-acetyltransferase [Actinomadura alba]MBC6469160.1 GNAT family N-acetyltransferase [Actinomadura alba]